MAYDEQLATRFRKAINEPSNISEKRMMGGLCFLHNGNMIGGADRNKEGSGRFMFRVGKDNETEALSRPGAANFGMAMAMSVVLMVVTGLVMLAVEHFRAGDVGTF